MRARASLMRIFISLLASFALLMVMAPSVEAQQYGWREARNKVESRARSQRGAPYRYGGSSPSGFDCSGFTSWVYEGLGVNLPRSSQEQFNLGNRDSHKRVWNRHRLETGDLVFHKTTSARVGHAGIYIGDGKFISSTSSDGVRIQSIWDPYYWGRRWVGGVRLPITQRK